MQNALLTWAPLCKAVSLLSPAPLVSPPGAQSGRARPPILSSSSQGPLGRGSRKAPCHFTKHGQISFQVRHFGVCIPVQLCQDKPEMVGECSSPPLWHTGRRDGGINYSGNEESLHLNTQHFLREHRLLTTVSQTGVCVHIYICIYILIYVHMSFSSLYPNTFMCFFS